MLVIDNRRFDDLPLASLPLTGAIDLAAGGREPGSGRDAADVRFRCLRFEFPTCPELPLWNSCGT